MNKRTGKEVIYRPTLGMMLTTISVFLVVMVFGVVVYTKMRGFWGSWQVWFGGAMVKDLGICRWCMWCVCRAWCMM